MITPMNKLCAIWTYSRYPPCERPGERRSRLSVSAPDRSRIHRWRPVGAVDSSRPVRTRLHPHSSVHKPDRIDGTRLFHRSKSNHVSGQQQRANQHASHGMEFQGQL